MRTSMECTLLHHLMDTISHCYHQVQLSHREIAENRFEQGKLRCLEATKTLSSLLGSKDPEITKKVRPLAQYTVEYYSSLLKSGTGALSFQEKVNWLSSRVFGSTWLPVLVKGFEIEPFELGEPKLQVPDSLIIEFRQVSCDSLLDGLADLYQDLLPNCSFVLSLLSISDAGMGAELRELVVGFGGKAKVTLHFNGCEREIALSTTLPFVDVPGRSLFVCSFSNQLLVWPALLEKAFLVATGEHYNFQGSNMAQDTYMLLGWLPEVRKISQSSSESIARLWKDRSSGLVTLGLGTGKMSQHLATQLNMVPEHDYVVCGYDEANGTITIKNPWMRADHLTDEVREKSRFLDVDLSILGLFSYLYVNWKPDYKHKSSATFIAALALVDTPQFLLVSSFSGEIGVLVEQYLGKPNCPFTVDIYGDTDGKVFTAAQNVCLVRETSTSRVHFFKFAVDPNEHTVVVTSEKPMTFALTIYHNQPITLQKAKSACANRVLLEDLWSLTSTGGNWAMESYIQNPQFDVQVGTGVSKMALLLSTDMDANVNFHVFHSEKDLHHKKLRNFDKSKLLFNDSYTRREHFKEFPVEPGSYRLVVSCFENNAGDFKLVVMNDGDPVLVSSVPRALGLFNEEVQFLWNSSNRHKLKFRTGFRDAQLTFHLRAGIATAVSYRPAIRASIFDGLTQVPLVVTSQWNESIYGVFLDCTVPEVDRDYILLVERFETGDGVCRVAVGGSCKVEFRH